MANETEAATHNPTEAANSSSEAPKTLLASAGTEPGKQTQTTGTQQPPAAEKPATETTTTEEKPAEGAKPPEAAKPQDGAPEKYEFKAPEGTVYDPDVLDTFTGAARKANLSQDAAQKILDEMAPALIARQVDQVKAIHSEWTEASKADKEFGGEKLQENLAVAKKGLEAFATPELRKLLDDTGLGNHPEVLRYFFRAGKAISGDTFVGGRSAAGSQKDPLSVLYPNS